MKAEMFPAAAAAAREETKHTNQQECLKTMHVIYTMEYYSAIEATQGPRYEKQNKTKKKP